MTLPDLSVFRQLSEDVARLAAISGRPDRVCERAILRCAGRWPLSAHDAALELIGRLVRGDDLDELWEDG